MLTNRFFVGDCVEVMRSFPFERIDCAMFSPPYWGLRDYEVENQIGLEKSFSRYIENLVKVCREIKRILKRQGNLWIVLGDTFSSKQKLLIPHRVAIALQRDGWICRGDIVWYKPNVIPSSAKDRLTVSKEFIFHFVRSRKYYFDLNSIREPCETNWRKRESKRETYKGKFKGFGEKAEKFGSPRARSERGSYKIGSRLLGKTPRDVCFVNTRPYSGAHFAVYPKKLCVLPIKATCPPFGVVLDPMCGSGTTCIVARRLGRQWIGIDLNPEYIEIARKRMKEEFGS